MNNTLVLNGHALSTTIQKLAKTHLIFEQGNYQVFLIKAKDAPDIMEEIGRLREITFRAAGEGTGKDLDIDRFDAYYWQLVIWDKAAQQIVGGYRLGLGAEIMQQYGIAGFYTSTLFEIHNDFGSILSRTIELGRSFVTIPYQRKRLSLFLLWKGILHVLMKHPEYQFLFGPVSISRYYSTLSKSAIVYFLKQHYFDATTAKNFTPKQPYFWQLDKQYESALESPNLKSLNKLVRSFEMEKMPVPVLIRQYVLQNAKFVGFNLDPNFNDALDGLMLLNLKDLPNETIEMLKKQW